MTEDDGAEMRLYPLKPTFRPLPLIDRLVHKAELVQLAGESFRFKESTERQERRSSRRKRS